MSPLLQLLILITTYLNTALALTIAQSSTLALPTTPNTTASTNFNHPTREWECRSGGSLFLPRPSLQDCAIAITAIPSASEAGTFHTGGLDDKFLLPLEARMGSCLVRVALLNEVQRESGNWREVKSQASALLSGCLAISVESWFTGANTAAGDDGKIGIQFEYSG